MRIREEEESNTKFEKYWSIEPICSMIEAGLVTQSKKIIVISLKTSLHSLENSFEELLALLLAEKRLKKETKDEKEE